jgi:hypothetical protein
VPRKSEKLTVAVSVEHVFVSHVVGSFAEEQTVTSMDPIEFEHLQSYL